MDATTEGQSTNPTDEPITSGFAGHSGAIAEINLLVPPSPSFQDVHESEFDVANFGLGNEYWNDKTRWLSAKRIVPLMPSES